MASCFLNFNLNNSTHTQSRHQQYSDHHGIFNANRNAPTIAPPPMPPPHTHPKPSRPPNPLLLLRTLQQPIAAQTILRRPSSAAILRRVRRTQRRRNARDVRPIDLEGSTESLLRQKSLPRPTDAIRRDGFSLEPGRLGAGDV